ncbi:MAG: hypothetical protein AAF216_00615 [Pseudomonadota bacterium]
MMNAIRANQKHPVSRLAGLFYALLIYPFVFFCSSLSRSLGQRYTDTHTLNPGAPLEAHSNVRAVLPWVYYP